MCYKMIGIGNGCCRGKVMEAVTKCDDEDDEEAEQDDERGCDCLVRWIPCVIGEFATPNGV